MCNACKSCEGRRIVYISLRTGEVIKDLVDHEVTYRTCPACNGGRAK